MNKKILFYIIKQDKNTNDEKKMSPDRDFLKLLIFCLITTKVC